MTTLNKLLYFICFCDRDAVFKEIKYFCLKLIFLVFLYCFDMLILKVNLKK